MVLLHALGHLVRVEYYHGNANPTAIALTGHRDTEVSVQELRSEVRIYPCAAAIVRIKSGNS
jgi:hypothetical protein